MLQSGTIESSPRIGRLCVARAVRDGAFIIGVSAELDDLRVAAGLRSAGLKVVPYRGKSFGRVDDIARQLARQGCDAYLFWIDADTAAATRRIVFQLRKLRADVSILLWGDGVVDASALGAWVAGARTLAHANAAEVVAASQAEEPRLVPVVSAWVDCSRATKTASAESPNAAEVGAIPGARAWPAAGSRAAPFAIRRNGRPGSATRASTWCRSRSVRR